MKVHGRVIFAGNASGPVLFTSEPLLIYGGIDTRTGRVLEKGHPLEEKCVKGTILVFPSAKGSTVGSYTLLQLAKNGVAPSAIINESCEPIVATGAIISKIPCIDKVNISMFHDAKHASVSGEVIDITDITGET